MTAFLLLTSAGECDPSEAHPVAHSIPIDVDPPLGEQGFGCWSTHEEISDATETMIERMEALLQSLTARDSGM